MSFAEIIFEAAITIAKRFIKNPGKQAEIQHLVDELAELLDTIRSPKTP